MNERSQFFLKDVKNQIKSKEAKEFVTAELNHHLKEAKNEWMKRGFNEADAEEKAVKQMGSPLIVGQQLNKLYRPKIDWLTVSLLIISFGLGFLPMFSLGYMGAGYFSINKVIFVLFGAAAALGMMYIDYRKLKKLGWLFYTIGVLILLTITIFSNVLVFGQSLIEIGPLTIESLMAVPFFFLAWTSFFNNSRLKVWHFVILFLFSFYLFFSVLSTSTAYIYTVMVFVMLWWSKFSRKAILTILSLTVSLVVVTGVILWQFLELYQISRVLAFINPEKYQNYTILHIKALMYKSGWFGSSMNDEIIPDAHTNFIFVSFTYHYGWLLAAAIVLILSLFVARIIVITTKIKDSYSKLLLIGVIALFMVQFISNIGMSFGLFPLMPMSLPFISYGLMPVLLNAFLVGVVLSVYRRKDLLSFDLTK
jgi:cell division protein FtsW (lipid II flippase)